MRIAAWILLTCCLWPSAAAAERLDPARAARLAEAERALAADRLDEASTILDELAGSLEVEEAVLAARLELELRRAGITERTARSAGLPASVESAVAALERRAATGPRACRLLATAALVEGDRRAALEWLRKAVAQLADAATVLRLALLDLELRETAEAARLALELLRTTPRCPALLQLAGQALVAEGEAERAEAVLERLLELAPDNAEAHSLLGAALLLQRRLPEAIEHFRRALDLEPGDTHRVNLGYALTLAGSPQEAIPLLEAVTTRSPGHLGAWNNLGIAYAGAGRLIEARAALSRALELDPTNESLRRNLEDLETLLRAPPPGP